MGFILEYNFSRKLVSPYTLANSVEGTVTGIWVGKRDIVLQFLAEKRDSSLLHYNQTANGKHPTSYSKCIAGKSDGA